MPLFRPFESRCSRLSLNHLTLRSLLPLCRETAWVLLLRCYRRLVFHAFLLRRLRAFLILLLLQFVRLAFLKLLFA